MSRYVFEITPRPWSGIMRLARTLFRIPEKCFYLETEINSKTGKLGRYMTPQEKIDCDYNPVGCSEYVKTGKCGHILSEEGKKLKERVFRYNDYKDELLTMAKAQGFQLPPCGWSIYFFFPIPDYWPKKRKLLMHGQQKMSKPDVTNLIKSFEDALTITDEKVSQRSGEGKFWVNQPKGYIEVLINQPVYNPFGVEWVDQDAVMQAPKRKYIRHGQTVGKTGKKKQRKLFKQDKEIS